VTSVQCHSVTAECHVETPYFWTTLHKMAHILQFIWSHISAIPHATSVYLLCLVLHFLVSQLPFLHFSIPLSFALVGRCCRL